MRDLFSCLLAATALVVAVPNSAEARRPTPIPTLLPEQEQPAAIALLANQDAVMKAEGETLLKEMARSLYISADRETEETGVDLYFLRVEGGEVVSLMNTVLNSDDLAYMRARFPDEARLPGDTFLIGDAIVPVGIYLGAEQRDVRIGKLSPRDERDEQMFSAASRLSNGGTGIVVAAYPAAEPDSLAGGGFFLPR